MSMTLLPGIGPEIGTGMIATVAATVFVTGALKGVVGLGLSTGSVVVFSLLYGLESALCLLVAPTVATNLWQGAAGGHARALIARFWPGLVAIVPGVWAGSHLIGTLAPGQAERGLGVALMTYVGLTLATRSRRYAPRAERTVTLLAGSTNGLVTGAAGVLVIPMVPYCAINCASILKQNMGESLRTRLERILSARHDCRSEVLGVATHGAERRNRKEPARTDWPGRLASGDARPGPQGSVRQLVTARRGSGPARREAPKEARVPAFASMIVQMIAIRRHTWKDADTMAGQFRASLERYAGALGPSRCRRSQPPTFSGHSARSGTRYRLAPTPPANASAPCLSGRSGRATVPSTWPRSAPSPAHRARRCIVPSTIARSAVRRSLPGSRRRAHQIETSPPCLCPRVRDLDRHALERGTGRELERDRPRHSDLGNTVGADEGEAHAPGPALGTRDGNPRRGAHTRRGDGRCPSVPRGLKLRLS